MDSEMEQEMDPELETVVKKKRIATPPLKPYYSDDSTYEIGVDEVGRGPLFGRVYTASAILPKDDSFDHSQMKDSKKFHSKKKMTDVSEYIKANAISWSISYEDEKVVDDINILQATQQSMHKCIIETVKKMNGLHPTLSFTNDIKLLVDGNYFKPCVIYNSSKKQLEQLPFVCIEGGDNKYSAIAAASILAKVARDEYIEELCDAHPYLVERYSLDSNKGYGAKKHLDGIKTHGITVWHRKTFGICKGYA